MVDEDGTETKPMDVVIGPAALAGVAFAVRAIRRRSLPSAVLAVGLFGVEAGYRPYRRLLGKGARSASRTSPPGPDVPVE